MEDFVLLEMCFVSPKLFQNEKLKNKKIFFPPTFHFIQRAVSCILLQVHAFAWYVEAQS